MTHMHRVFVYPKPENIDSGANDVRGAHQVPAGDRGTGRVC